MTTRSALVAAASASLLLLATTLSSQTPDAAAAAPAAAATSQTAATAPAATASSPGVSKVRIVRLSEAKGQVQLDRNNGRGYEPGITNLPIVENSRLKTGEGVAEVEFEDNSSLRIAPDTIVEFPQLERTANGATVSTVHLLQGMAYVSLLKSNGNQFNLTVGEERLALSAPSHFRVHLLGTEAEMAVLDGNLHVVNGAGVALDVPKKKTITFDLMQHQQPTVAKDVAPEAFDSWDHTAVDYHSRIANVSAFNGSPYSYGMNDMSYYGSFVDGCGGGMMWRPYFASAAWDPYSNGAWAWYQGAGYSWVSPYPWGWMPYHYGSWSYCQGTGWGWMPGGSWNGLNNIAGIPGGGGGGGLISVGSGNQLRPLPPTHMPQPPRANEPGLIAVNAKPVVRSEMVSREQFTFRNDSAGLGIPRDGFGKLNKVSGQVQQHGSVNQSVYFSSPAQGMQNNRPTSTAIMAGSIHRGSAPPPSMNAGSYGGNSGGNAGRGSAPTGSSVPSSPAPVSRPAPAPAPSGGGGSGRVH
jgi:hypothetical protein